MDGGWNGRKNHFSFQGMFPERIFFLFFIHPFIQWINNLRAITLNSRSLADCLAVWASALYIFSIKIPSRFLFSLFYFTQASSNNNNNNNRKRIHWVRCRRKSELDLWLCSCDKHFKWQWKKYVFSASWLPHIHCLTLTASNCCYYCYCFAFVCAAAGEETEWNEMMVAVKMWKIDVIKWRRKMFIVGNCNKND